MTGHELDFEFRGLLACRDSHEIIKKLVGCLRRRFPGDRPIQVVARVFLRECWTCLTDGDLAEGLDYASLAEGPEVQQYCIGGAP